MLLHPKHGELLLNKLLRPQLVPFGKTLFKKNPKLHSRWQEKLQKVPVYEWDRRDKIVRFLDLVLILSPDRTSLNR